MRHASFSIPYLVLIPRTDHIQNGQDFLDSLARMKLEIPIMTRYEQWRANPSSVQPASHPVPHSIGELAERAKQILGEDPKPFKAWLRIAENARRDAKGFQEQDDLESAFVEYAKAATIVLEKLPSHPDYNVILSTEQRHNMGLVSYFYPECPHNGVSVGHVHVPFDECIFRVLHGCHRFQCTHLSHLKSQPLIPLH
jgi:USP8 dimerisation domain